MKNKLTGKILMVVALMAATSMVIICIELTLGTSAVAQSGARGPGSGSCSNRTLFGNYGTQIEGTILGPNLPLRGVFMAHYDGEGNLTLVYHIVLNGMPPEPAEEWRPCSGTYT